VNADFDGHACHRDTVDNRQFHATPAARLWPATEAAVRWLRLRLASDATRSGRHRRSGLRPRRSRTRAGRDTRPARLVDRSDAAAGGHATFDPQWTGGTRTPVHRRSLLRGTVSPQAPSGRIRRYTGARGDAGRSRRRGAPGDDYRPAARFQRIGSAGASQGKGNCTTTCYRCNVKPALETRRSPSAEETYKRISTHAIAP
jgi:hypothetical protein